MGLAPEYAPNHKWNYAKNEFLCSIWRWYEREPLKFAACFNKFFDLRLATSKIKAHFENYLRLHGPKAFLVYRDVYSVPFDDPEGKYEALRGIIEDLAASLGISLCRLSAEVSSLSGKARTAKSPKTRRLYRALVRRASQEERVAVAQVSLVQEQPSVPRPYLGGLALSTNEEFEASEILVESAESPCPYESPISRRAGLPSLVFRVWDSNSATLFSEEHGFVSYTFTSWARPFPPPFAPKGLGKHVLTILTHTHLSKQGGPSAFVSTTTSLLQALTKASAMLQPHIAVIDLSHPSLAEVPHKVLHAADCLRYLKAQGQAGWARYKGRTEYMVWSDISREAIIQHFSLADLVALYDADGDVARLLSLDKFVPGLKTKTLSARLRKQHVVLDAHAARAMGRCAKLFGLDGEVKINHVIQFIARLVDGWSISTAQCNEQNAQIFSTTLGSQVHSAKDIAGCFKEGIQQGIDALAYFSRGRQPATTRIRTELFKS
ncbi:hypothetical protein BDU57DRAFT_541030 [Ampelomyces quisqualis]|uniref:DUF7587 domain-containing protein n=1 Tax=Ampelomyces quisqualis TaxID=50730 RepID=A0A6A5QHS8_AMPQU|nr:hypothetical protein BDU57DRAFT_541030 [Ampelomyces quisqualis]